jgi:antitoxin component YwqK of YwqJK toxin-antitoxin module
MMTSRSIRTASCNRPLFAVITWAAVLLAGQASAQTVQPYVDHWDSLKTVKKSEGLMVNGREWGEWKFWDTQGRLTEASDFKSGQRDGHVVIYYDNGQVQHDGWIHRGQQDSVMHSFYRSGQAMEEGLYANGTKQGPWNYWYADGRKMLTEVCDKGTCLAMDAWDPDGSQTLKQGDGSICNWYPSGDTASVSQYRLGVLSGEQREYWPAGNLKAKGSWIGGMKDGSWEYRGSDNAPEHTETWNKGKLDGPYTAWHTNGPLNVTGHYRQGQKDSTWTWYTSTGDKDMLGNFTEDQQDGLWKYWYPRRSTQFHRALCQGQAGRRMGALLRRGPAMEKGELQGRAEGRDLDHPVRKRAEAAGR